MAESLASRALVVAAALMPGGCAGGDARTAPVDEVSVAGTGGVARAATTELPAAPPPAVVRPLPDAASASAQPLGGQLPAASRPTLTSRIASVFCSKAVIRYEEKRLSALIASCARWI